MRTHGSVSKWNDDRGFGFIAPADGGAELFVHVSAFPRDGRRPSVGEIVSYETESVPDGRTRAVRIVRPGQAARARPARGDDRERESPRVVQTVIAVLLIGGALGYAYHRMQTPAIPARPAVQLTDAQKIPASFECEHHTMCSQMHSCEEARRYLQTCPNTEMDGDGDGVPCEDQWCNAD